MSLKEELKESLDLLCQRIMEVRGTLKTEIFNYDYQIRHHIEQMFKVGIPKVEVDAIISKYEPTEKYN